MAKYMFQSAPKTLGLPIQEEAVVYLCTYEDSVSFVQSSWHRQAVSGWGTRTPACPGTAIAATVDAIAKMETQPKRGQHQLRSCRDELSSRGQNTFRA